MGGLLPSPRLKHPSLAPSSLHLHVITVLAGPTCENPQFLSSPPVISQLPAARLLYFPGNLSHRFMHYALDIFLIYVYTKTDTYIIFRRFFIFGQTSYLVKRWRLPSVILRSICKALLSV
jgi:hypothetical protein